MEALESLEGCEGGRLILLTAISHRRNWTFEAKQGKSEFMLLLFLYACLSHQLIHALSSVYRTNMALGSGGMRGLQTGFLCSPA